MSSHDAGPKTWGILAEFATGDELVAATRAAREAGYTRMDGYSPFPIGEVADELDFPRSEIGPIMFIGGVCGAVLGFCLQAWTTGVEYQLTIAGKPFVSWPMFVPITWELLVLTASMSGFFGLLALCGLPQPHHPLFNVPQFARASRDRFFLAIEAVDPQFDATKTATFLAGLNPQSVAEVPHE
ncbi:MAG: DUF3341 domain-containing protein [Gemmataceae bacterium]